MAFLPISEGLEMEGEILIGPISFKIIVNSCLLSSCGGYWSQIGLCTIWSCNTGIERYCPVAQGTFCYGKRFRLLIHSRRKTSHKALINIWLCFVFRCKKHLHTFKFFSAFKLSWSSAKLININSMPLTSLTFTSYLCLQNFNFFICQTFVLICSQYFNTVWTYSCVLRAAPHIIWGQNLPNTFQNSHKLCTHLWHLCLSSLQPLPFVHYGIML